MKKELIRKFQTNAEKAQKNPSRTNEEQFYSEPEKSSIING